MDQGKDREEFLSTLVVRRTELGLFESLSLCPSKIDGCSVEKKGERRGAKGKGLYQHSTPLDQRERKRESEREGGNIVMWYMYSIGA